MSIPLNRRVIIERPSTERNAIGELLAGWTEVATVWANIRYLNGVETIKAGAETSIAKASIRIRYRTDLDASMRARYGETVFGIKTILPDEGARWHVDLACEVVA